MCGISGYISPHSFDGSASRASLQHRGPDSSGEYRETIAGKKVCLQHTRLSIIDLSNAGHQPMISNDGTCVIIYNGEVYNFKELKSRFLKGYRFNSQTDTEVILCLYQKLGISFVKELNGDFAIALLDKANSKFYLIRDHFGVKPLYYFIKNGDLFFGSEIKSILAYGINPEMDEEALENYFVFKYSPQSNTLFKNIRRLPPSHFLELDISNGHHSLSKYWAISKIVLPESYSRRKEELYSLIEDAVKIRLMSDVPVGTFFSGGIDSSIIAWFLKDIPQITHYTARKTLVDLQKEGTTSDFHFAEMLSRIWGLNLIPVDISSSEANADLIDKTLWFSDDLIADGSQIPSWLITGEARKTSTVMLSGMGADELFFGYKGHQLAFLAKKFSNFPSFILNPVIHLLASLNQGKGIFKPYKRHLKQFGRYYSGFGKNRYGMFSVVGDYYNAVTLLNNPQHTAMNIFDSYFNNDEDIFDNLFRFDQENFLVKNLHYVDRMCMANSMEGRVPFLDCRIAEFAYSLPLDEKISPFGDTKRIMKDCFSPVLPKALIARRKAGFGMPLRSIFSSEKKVYELLDIGFFSGFNIINIDHIKRIIKNHIDGKEDNASLIYALISFRLWYEMWIKSDHRSFTSTN
jgi:asparagine synthase (glutamine-hydrolysing)